jgi:hypothetical protein
MADFAKALKVALKFEFSKPENALHTNPGEEGYTFCGVYEKANPKWGGWTKIKEIIAKNKGDLKKASVAAYKDKELLKLVDEVYLKNYWNPYRLGELNQTAAEEIFCFGINSNMKTAIKKAQIVVGVLADGVIGPKTINAINGSAFFICMFCFFCQCPLNVGLRLGFYNKYCRSSFLRSSNVTPASLALAAR